MLNLIVSEVLPQGLIYLVYWVCVLLQKNIQKLSNIKRSLLFSRLIVLIAADCGVVRIDNRGSKN